jgi:hypothetical protein
LCRARQATRPGSVSAHPPETESPADDPNGIGHYEHHLPLTVRIAHFFIVLCVVAIAAYVEPQILAPYEVGHSKLWGPDAAYHSGRDEK